MRPCATSSAATCCPCAAPDAAQMRLVFDPLKLREAAARLDALGSPAADVDIEEVIAETVPARWSA